MNCQPVDYMYALEAVSNEEHGFLFHESPYYEHVYSHLSEAGLVKIEKYFEDRNDVFYIVYITELGRQRIELERL